MLSQVNLKNLHHVMSSKTKSTMMLIFPKRISYY